MDKRTCRLCGRRFANGLARAGHMRSHALASAKARPIIIPASPSSSEETAACYGPRGNSRAADPDFPSAVAAVDAAASSSVVQDGESDAESSIALGPSLLLPRRRRSKRPASPPERISSSVSSVTPEEDVARCLMMLSRDVWTESAAAEKEGAGSEEKDRIAGDRSRRRRRKPLPVAGQSGYQCGTCKKVFGSYHALGGHRAGHKKAKGSCLPAGQIRIHADASDVDLINERSFGVRIDSSNQAFASPLLRPSPIGANYISISPAAPKLGAESSIIDLEVQDFELSAVSVAEFAPDE